MLSQAQRTTILELNVQQVSKREIARVLGISRVAVRKVLRSNSTTVPELQRPEKAEPHRQQILELFDQCKGNLVRVHEELLAGGAKLSYTALTAFCRRHGIGYAAPASSSSWTRTRFPLHWSKSSRICCLCGSAFSGRCSSGTVVELERSTLRTATREIPSTRAISRLLTCCTFSSRIVVRCAWLNMRFLLR